MDTKLLEKKMESISPFEILVQDYLSQEMCDNRPPRGAYDLFATEGGTAAMCYIFDSLQENFLLNKGDGIVLMVPAFPPLY